MNYYDYLTDFIFAEHEPKKSDYIFIPGSGRGELAEKAAGLYRQGFAEKIVASGKYSILKDCFEGPVSPERYLGGPFETESDFLAQVLIDNQVPPDAVLLERRATYTFENAIYTRKLLGDKAVGRAILVCKSYHARRCLLYYSILFPETELLVCPVNIDGISRDNWHRSPEKIDVVLGEIARIGNQFGDILKGKDTGARP